MIISMGFFLDLVANNFLGIHKKAYPLNESMLQFMLLTVLQQTYTAASINSLAAAIA